jgi:HEAT repeat protein
MPTPKPIDGEAPDRVLPRRDSRLVTKGRPAGVLARERVEQLLRAHDPEEAAANASRLEPGDRDVLRVIAAETGSAESDPSLRRNAIAALGRLGAVDDLNMLVDLARSDPDPLVRSSALLSLADTALVLVAPVLRDALSSKDAVERVAAEKAITRLARDLGNRAVLDALRPPGGVSRLVKAAESLLTPQRQKTSTRAKPRRARTDSTQG